MKRALKDAWIAALRSGDYKQGWCQLRDEQDRFCALGVLCDVTPGRSWSGGGVWLDDNRGPAIKLGSATLTLDGLWFSGLSRDEAFILERLNDTDQWSFAEIANWIENNIKMED